MRPFSLLLAVLACSLGCKSPASCHGAKTACLEVTFSKPGAVISPLLFGDGLEWKVFGQDILKPDFSAVTPGTLREDVMQVLQGTGLTVLRFPGGTLADLFHWQEAIGPIGGRKNQRGMEEQSPGVLKDELPWFGPDEFAQLTARLNVESVITLNVMTGTPEEAAGWVRHAKELSQRVRYWEIGNEPYLPLVNAAVAPALTPEEYASRFNAFATAIRAVDPSAKLLLTLWRNYSGGCLSYCEDDWNRRVLAHLTQKADLIAVHNAYAPAATDRSKRAFRAALAAPISFRENLHRQIQEVNDLAPPQTRDAPFALTEHASFFLPDSNDPAVFVPEIQMNQTLGAALYSALVFNVMVTEPRMQIANHINPLSPYFQAPVTTAMPDLSNFPVSYPTGYVPNPTVSAYGHVFALYRPLASGKVVPLTLSGASTYDSETTGLAAGLQGVPVLDAVAAVSNSGDRAWLLVVNRDLDSEVSATLALPGLTYRSAVVEQLNGPSYEARNRPGEPPVVTVSALAPLNPPQGEDVHFSFVFPAHSLTRFTFKRE